MNYELGLENEEVAEGSSVTASLFLTKGLFLCILFARVFDFSPLRHGSVVCGFFVYVASDCATLIMEMICIQQLTI